MTQSLLTWEERQVGLLSFWQEKEENLNWMKTRKGRKSELNEDMKAEEKCGGKEIKEVKIKISMGLSLSITVMPIHVNIIYEKR